MSNSSKHLRKIGISLDKFYQLLSELKKEIEIDLNNNPMKKRGIRSKDITTKDKLLLTLTYLRHYPTFLNLGDMFGISESYANKIYHKITNYLIKFIHVKKTADLSSDDVTTVIVDAAEQPIERPVKKQKSYYSGKKKRHTLKAQLVVSLESKVIYGLSCDKGKTHDFKLFKNSKVIIPKEIKLLGDSGYQGIHNIHANSQIPIKKPKGKELTKEQKKHNHLLSKKRILVENIIRRCKIFRITKDVYRGKHKNYGKVWNLIAGLVNFRYCGILIH